MQLISNHTSGQGWRSLGASRGFFFFSSYMHAHAHAAECLRFGINCKVDNLDLVMGFC